MPRPSGPRHCAQLSPLAGVIARIGSVNQSERYCARNDGFIGRSKPTRAVETERAFSMRPAAAGASLFDVRQVLTTVRPVSNRVAMEECLAARSSSRSQPARRTRHCTDPRHRDTRAIRRTPTIFTRSDPDGIARCGRPTRLASSRPPLLPPTRARAPVTVRVSIPALEFPRARSRRRSGADGTRHRDLRRLASRSSSVAPRNPPRDRAHRHREPLSRPGHLLATARFGGMRFSGGAWLDPSPTGFDISSRWIDLPRCSSSCSFHLPSPAAWPTDIRQPDAPRAVATLTLDGQFSVAPLGRYPVITGLPFGGVSRDEAARVLIFGLSDPRARPRHVPHRRAGVLDEVTDAGCRATRTHADPPIPRGS